MINKNEIEQIVNRQLDAYNKKDFENFASCYDKNIVSFDLETAELKPHLSGHHFFIHYKNKFANNSTLHCEVTSRMVHGSLVVDKEIISYASCKKGELVIYEVCNGLISKMWFSQETLLN